MDPARADEDWRARTGVVLQSWRDHPRWTPRRLLTQLGAYYEPYWLGLGMRSAFLPDSAAALEIGGSWRTLETGLVLTAWAIVGAMVTPLVLKRMSRRQSGSQMEAAREAALQWVR